MVTGTADTKLTAEQQGGGRPATAPYLEAQTAELVTATKAFTDAVDGGQPRARPRQLYAPSRIAYERIEPVAETFGDLDPKIDAREGDVPKKDWGGFHYIEQTLWVDGTTDGLSDVHGRRSTSDVNALANLVKDVELQPGVASPTVRSSCSTRCRRRRSRARRSATRAPTSSTSRRNVQGAEAAFDSVKPILDRKNPRSRPQIDTKLRRRRHRARSRTRRARRSCAYTALTQGGHQGALAGDRRAGRAALEGGEAGRRAREHGEVGESPSGSSARQGPRSCHVGCARCDREAYLGSRTARCAVAATAPHRARRRRALPRPAPGRDRHAGAGPPAVRVVRRHHRRPRRPRATCCEEWTRAARRMTAGQPGRHRQRPPGRAARRHRRGRWASGPRR